MTNLKAVLFDFDGTLCDSKELLFQCFFDFCIFFKININKLDINEFDGLPINKIVENLFHQRLSKSELIERENIYNQIIDEKLKNVEPIIGAIQFIELCSQFKLRMGIVSSNSRKRIKKFLKSFSIENNFEFLICEGDYSVGKPAPDPYYLALNRMNIKKDEAIAIDDSILGITSSIDAGISSYLYDPLNLNKDSDLYLRFGSYDELEIRLSKELRKNAKLNSKIGSN